MVSMQGESCGQLSQPSVGMIVAGKSERSSLGGNHTKVLIGQMLLWN